MFLPLNYRPTKQKARGFVNPRALRSIRLNTDYGGGHLPVAVSNKLAILRSNLTRHGASDRWYKPAADSVLDIRCHTRAFTIVFILYRKMRNCQAVFFATALELLVMIRDGFDTGQSMNARESV